MLFPVSFTDGIACGSITLTFRRWKRLQAVVGNKYRTPAGFVEVITISVVDPHLISEAEAVRAGHLSAESLLAQLPDTPGLPTYRIEFHYVGGPDPRAELANAADLSDDEVASIRRRLARMDAAAVRPWTRETLVLIRDHPEVRAADLAEMVQRERLDFKRDVRKLKNLGLTLSFNPGYRVSPRGEEFLAADTL